MHRARVLVSLVVILAALSATSGGSDRATSPLTIEGTVQTGDGTDIVRGASVALLVYDAGDALVHTDLKVTGEGGNYTFVVPANMWDPGVNATLRASYALVGEDGSTDFVLEAGTHMDVDVRIPWNRTLGARVTVEDPQKATPRDGQASYVVSIVNEGNDTDPVVLWAIPEDPGVVAVFHPGNFTELGPGEEELVGLRVSGPGLGPGDYGVALGWRSQWYAGEGGAIDLTWTVNPEVDISVNSSGVSWWPDPLFHGEQADLNCTIRNDGRDAARLTNVSLELVHPTAGQVLRDRVRIDVPAMGTAMASFPWTAEYSEDPYLLRFSVEHPYDVDHDDDLVELQLPVGVRNEPPAVSFIAPGNGSHVNGTVVVRLSVTDPDTPVTGVRLRIGDGEWVSLGTVAPFTHSWDSTRGADGWYVLEAQASDRYSDSEVARVEVKVENMGPNHAPEVYIEAPQDGDTVGDPMVALGIAFDEDDNVKYVEVRIDGGAWMMADGSTRWNISVPTTSLAVGPHTMEVRGHDGIDPSAVEAVTFKVTDREALALNMHLQVEPGSVLPGELVTVRGELLYDNGVRAPGLEVRIEGPSALLVYKTTDVRGTFELSTSAPSSEGEYEYQASSSDDGGLSASNITILRVLKSLDPDLAVEAIRVESDKVAVGLNVTVAMDLRNKGFRVGNGTLRVWAGGVGVGDPVESRKVTVYDSITLTIVWVPENPGEVELTVEVLDVLPGDADPGNNRRSIFVEVLNLPDLTIEGLVLSNPTPYDNTTVTVSVRVANLGGLNASATVRVYMDGTDPDDLVAPPTDVGVAANGVAHATVDFLVLQGAHRIHVEIANVFPEESRSDNNRASIKFEVKGPYKPPKKDEKGPLPGYGGLAALVALSAAAVASWRMRAPRPGG